MTEQPSPAPTGVLDSLRIDASLERGFMVVEEFVTEHLDGAPALLGTPALISLMEQVAAEVTRPHLARGFATVGTHIDVRHLKPSYLGDVVVFSAALASWSGRRLRYRVEARVGDRVVGRGEVEQGVISLDRFRPAQEQAVRGRPGAREEH